MPLQDEQESLSVEPMARKGEQERPAPKLVGLQLKVSTRVRRNHNHTHTHTTGPCNERASEERAITVQ